MDQHNSTPEESLGDNQGKDTGNAENASTESSIPVHDIVNDANRFTTPKRNPAIFPIDVFPEALQVVLVDTNEALNYPIEYTGASMIFAASLGIGNTHKVSIKQNWVENSACYIALVGSAGINKSHPLSFVLKAFHNLDQRSYMDYQVKLEKYAIELQKIQKDRDNAIEQPKKPVWQKKLVTDFTIEALYEVHKHNVRGIGVYADELAGWLKNFNRYHKGAEQEFWLSTWSSKPITIDRKTGEPIFIPEPFIPVIGTIQNGLINEMAKESRNQNGFIDRILFVLLEHAEKKYWSEKELKAETESTWNNILLRINDLQLHFTDSSHPLPTILKPSEEARETLFQWQKENTDKSNEAESESHKSIYSKLEIMVIRLSLIMEILFWACGESDKKAISVKSMKAAIGLIEYFRYTALRVNKILSSIHPVDRLPDDKRLFYETLPKEFSTEAGVQIAATLGIPERTAKRFFTQADIFKQPKRGVYQKIG